MTGSVIGDRRRVVRAQVDVVYLAIGHTPGVAAARPTTMRLRWRAADPHVVEARFPDSAKEVRWLLGRELLATGCGRPVGVGDVSVMPDPFTPGVAELVLSTDSGRACFRLCTRDLAAFLDRLDPPGEVTDADVAAVITGSDERPPGRGDHR